MRFLSRFKLGILSSENQLTGDELEVMRVALYRKKIPLAPRNEGEGDLGDEGQNSGHPETAPSNLDYSTDVNVTSG